MTSRDANAVRRAQRLSRLRRRARWLGLAAAALPLYQTFCFPDLLGAINFELQNFINGVLFTIVDTVVRNIFRL